MINSSYIIERLLEFDALVAFFESRESILNSMKASLS